MPSSAGTGGDRCHWPAVFEIRGDGTAHVVGQGQHTLAPALAPNSQMSSIPVAVTELQRDHFIGSQSKPCQDQEDGSIAQSDRCAEVAAVDRPLSVVGRDRQRKRGVVAQVATAGTPATSSAATSPRY